MRFLQNENEIMEAMEGMDTLIQESNQSVREVAKLADSKEVRVSSLLLGMNSEGCS